MYAIPVPIVFLNRIPQILLVMIIERINTIITTTIVFLFSMISCYVFKCQIRYFSPSLIFSGSKKYSTPFSVLVVYNAIVIDELKEYAISSCSVTGFSFLNSAFLMYSKKK